MRKLFSFGLVVLIVAWMSGCGSPADNTNANMRNTNSNTAVNKATPYEASPTPTSSQMPDTYRNNNAANGNRSSNKNPTADEPPNRGGDSTGMRGATPSPTHTPR